MALVSKKTSEYGIMQVRDSISVLCGFHAERLTCCWFFFSEGFLYLLLSLIICLLLAVEVGKTGTDVRDI